MSSSNKSRVSLSDSNRCHLSMLFPEAKIVCHKCTFTYCKNYPSDDEVKHTSNLGKEMDK